MSKLLTHLRRGGARAGALSGALGLALLSAPAAAQETPLDLGLLKQSDVSVVQKMLYSKEGRFEYGAAAGWAPFDSYTTTPLLGVYGLKHFSEELGVEVAAHGGYSLKNFTYKQLESDAYGIQPDAYAHIADIGANVQWAPIYAKLNWRGNKVLHHDVYGLAGGVLAVEKAMMPDGSMAFSPGASVGIGMRFFLSPNSALRVQIRDDLLVQTRVKTQDSQGTFLKQNVLLTVGYSRLSKGG